MATKRFVAVVTFDDEDNSVESLSDAALWLQLSLTRENKTVAVTAFSSAAIALEDEHDGLGDFAKPAERIETL